MSISGLQCAIGLRGAAKKDRKRGGKNPVDTAGSYYHPDPVKPGSREFQQEEE
jgi:hypothetical protein